MMALLVCMRASLDILDVADLTANALEQMSARRFTEDGTVNI